MTPVHASALALHIAAGSLAILAGFVALYSAKGARVHRMSGKVFVVAMIAMGLVGAAMAAVWGRQPASNITMGFLVAYLVTTGLTTVRPPEIGSRGWDLGAMLLAFALGLTQFAFGFVAYGLPRHSLKGIPFVAFFIFGLISLSAGAGDLRMIRAGGTRALRGATRIVRHLWRMTVALLIAAFSFFVGQSQVIPKPLRIGPLLVLPPLLVLASLLYWLWRIRIRRTLRGLISAGPAEPARAAVPELR